jgi:lipopolysaccharide export system protein LptC
MIKRKSTLLGVFFCLTAAISLWIIVDHFHTELDESSKTNAQYPDAYLINAHYQDYDKQGQLHGEVFSPHSIHFKKNNVTLLDKPTLSLHTNNKQPWLVSSKYGRSYQNTQSLYLWDNVLIHHPKAKHNVETKIKTSSLTIFPKKEIAQTKDPVTISRPGSTTKAKGLHANFKKGIFQLLKNARGSYAPNSQ